MGQKKDRREYFKSYYKTLSDEKKEELRKKKREAYKRKKLVNVLHAKVSSSTKITFGDTFTILKSYYISIVSVRLARPEYKFGDTKFQWSINNQSHVEEVIEEGEDIKGNTYNFVPLSDISDSNSEAEIDIIVVVLEILPPKIVKSGTLTLQQLLLADSNLTRITLSTWNNMMSTEIEALSKALDTNPIIIVTRTKLSIYNRIAGLNTRASSTIIIDPQIPEATLLRTWCSNHEDDLNQLRKNKHHTSTANTSKTATVDIHEVLTLEKLDTVLLIKASILIHDLQQKFWYMGCSYYKTKTVAKHNDAISCSCPHKDATAQPWFRVVAKLSNSTRIISATLFGNEMKKLTSCTPIQMMHLFEEL
ncbi:hypothetical protein MRB53_030363 [Persea americana]|uniref:Uncharacterized protein n=1 Tax=Persea americana TaxID=3435 RepID=A0ACC2KL11_PERAE|nr:hypothetical protein MRB53_030363 [Persea americana]